METRNDTRISVRLDGALHASLEQAARKSGEPLSALVRRVLEERFGALPGEKEESAYDALMRLGVIGCVKDLPSDLSTNKKYMEGFGKDAGENPR